MASVSEMTPAKAAAAIMGMNNVFYRGRGFLGGKYDDLRPGLRMNIIGNPGVDKANFELNDLRGVKPPPSWVLADERYIGPIFDESGIRFFLIYNSARKLFHYILDETVAVDDLLEAVRLAESWTTRTHRAMLRHGLPARAPVRTLVRALRTA